MGCTIIHEFLPIVHARDLREAVEKNIVVDESKLLANLGHVIHTPSRTFKAAKESMLRNFRWFLTGFY